MDVTLIAAVLIASLLHATWNALVKVGRDGLLTIFLFKVTTVPIAVLVLVFTGIPNLECLPYAFASGVVFLFYCVFLGHAYKHADLSLVYPIARGVAPPTLALLAVVFAGETLALHMLIGICFVSAGIILLAYMPRIDGATVQALTSAAGVGLMIATYTLLDGIGVRVAGDAIAYAAILNLASILTVGALVSARWPRAAMSLLAHEWRRGLIGGSLMYLAYAIVVFALMQAPMASVAALRETSVIFAAVIGTQILGEPLGVQRVIASCIVTIGVAIIIMARSGLE